VTPQSKIPVQILPTEKNYFEFKQASGAKKLPRKMSASCTISPLRQARKPSQTRVKKILARKMSASCTIFFIIY